MLMKKLSDDHYIVMDDSEIKEGDFVYSSDGGIFERHIDNPCQTVFSISKVTHSTQPLESVPLHKMPNGEIIDEIWYDKIKQLSLQEVKELIGEDIDVWSRKFEYLKEVNENIKHKSQDERIWIFGASDLGFTAGYNQALEDKKERKYTEDDFRKAWDLCTSNKDIGYGISFSDLMYSIQSLQPKTEWEVEIVDGKLKLKQ